MSFKAFGEVEYHADSKSASPNSLNGINIMPVSHNFISRTS